MIGTFGGINDQAIHSLQSGFHILWCPQLALWHQLSMHQSIVENRREFMETVVKTPGLSSPCTMECGEGLLTAFGLGFTPHIQGQAGTDLRLRPHPVDTLLP